jgi:hypothetical protein
MEVSVMRKGVAHPLSAKQILFQVLVAAGLLASAVCVRVQPAQAADQKTASVAIPMFLDTSLDSKKRTAGDEVQGKIAAPVELSDGTVLPRDAKVTGHITEAKARSKGDSESSLNIVFEKIAMPNGKTMNIKGYLQAVAPNPGGDQSGGGVDYGSSMNRSMEHAGPGMESHSAIPILNAQSVGVQGIKDLALGGDGMLTSPGKAVKLDHGAQMLLRAQLLGEQ